MEVTDTGKHLISLVTTIMTVRGFIVMGLAHIQMHGGLLPLLKVLLVIARERFPNLGSDHHHF